MIAKQTIARSTNRVIMTTAPTNHSPGYPFRKAPPGNRSGAEQEITFGTKWTHHDTVEGSQVLRSVHTLKIDWRPIIAF